MNVQQNLDFSHKEKLHVFFELYDVKLFQKYFWCPYFAVSLYTEQSALLDPASLLLPQFISLTAALAP